MHDFDLAKVDFSLNQPATDRYWYYQNQSGFPITGGGSYPTIEVDDERLVQPGVLGVVYQRGATVYLSLKLKNSNGFGIHCSTASPTASYVEFDLMEYWLTPSGGLSSFDVGPNSYSPWINFTISGLPDWVDVGYLNLNFDVNITVPSEGNAHYKNPMGLSELTCVTDSAATGLQTIPWVDFLVISCSWGKGAQGPEMTKEFVTTGMRFSLHPGGRLSYEPAGDLELLWARFPNDQHPQINLATFCDEILRLNTPTGLECWNDASVLCMAFHSQGIASTVTRHKALFFNTYVTTPMCPAPQPASTGAYQQYEFMYHATATHDSGEYDASSSYMFSYWGAIWFWLALGWPSTGGWLSLFWQNAVSGAPFGHCYGLQMGIPEFVIGYDWDCTPSNIFQRPIYD